MISTLEPVWLGVLVQVQGVNMLGSKGSHFLVFLAILGVATREIVSIGEQPSHVIAFIQTEQSLHNCQAFPPIHNGNNQTWNITVNKLNQNRTNL